MSKKIAVRSIITTFLFCITLPIASAEVVYPTQPILPSDSSGDEQFGFSLAHQGPLAIVGANEDNDLGSNSGSAFVFRYGGSVWLEEQKLLASDGAAGDMFGVSVALAGNKTFIGAPRDDDMGNSSGAVYVFAYDGQGWIETQKLVPEDGQPWDSFGTSLAAAGDLLVVGSANDEAAYNAGAVYVYRNQGKAFALETKLLASDASVSDLFGGAVSVDSNLIAVGAEGVSDFGGQSGAVYVFRQINGQWVEQQKIYASDADTFDEFGQILSIRNQLLMVGAPNEGSDLTGSPIGHGAAYIFRYNGLSWQQQAKLIHPGAALLDKFGSAVSIEGNYALSSAPTDDDNGNQSGSVFGYAFNGEEWLLDSQLFAEGKGVFRLGHTVSISEGFVLSSAKNGNVVFDYDLDLPEIPDVCSADIDGNSAVDIDDLLAVIIAWGSTNGGQADVDGSGIVDADDFVEVILGWGACVPDITPPTCPGDVNQDGVADIDDLLLVIISWGGADSSADIDGSGIVDTDDLLQVILDWGECSP